MNLHHIGRDNYNRLKEKFLANGIGWKFCIDDKHYVDASIRLDMIEDILSIPNAGGAEGFLQNALKYREDMHFNRNQFLIYALRKYIEIPYLKQKKTVLIGNRYYTVNIKKEYGYIGVRITDLDLTSIIIMTRIHIQSDMDKNLHDLLDDIIPHIRFQDRSNCTGYSGFPGATLVEFNNMVIPQVLMLTDKDHESIINDRESMFDFFEDIRNGEIFNYLIDGYSTIGLLMHILHGWSNFLSTNKLCSISYTPKIFNEPIKFMHKL